MANMWAKSALSNTTCVSLLIRLFSAELEREKNPDKQTADRGREMHQLERYLFFFCGTEKDKVSELYSET